MRDSRRTKLLFEDLSLLKAVFFCSLELLREAVRDRRATSDNSARWEYKMAGSAVGHLE